MSPLAESLLFASLITAADGISTEVGLSRGGVEAGPIQNRYLRAGVQMALLTSVDQAIQQIPRAKWPARIAVAAGTVLLVRNNIKDRRGVRLAVTVSW